MNIWIKCRDGLPDDMTMVIVRTDRGRIENGFRYKGKWFIGDATFFSAIGKVTEWIPMPGEEFTEEKEETNETEKATARMG